MRTLREYMTNEELLVYFMSEWGIEKTSPQGFAYLLEAIWEEIHNYEEVEAYEYCQRLMDFKQWLFDNL